MNTLRKCLILSGLGAMGIVAIIIMVKTARHRPTGTYEKVGKGIDEKLKESKEALDKATAHVHNVFEHIKGRKQ
jgi:hypothetical protein